jgi:hypothetical protein
MSAESTAGKERKKEKKEFLQKDGAMRTSKDAGYCKYRECMPDHLAVHKLVADVSLHETA